jgi:hypothetical protein
MPCRVDDRTSARNRGMGATRRLTQPGALVVFGAQAMASSTRASSLVLRSIGQDPRKRAPATR